MVTLRNAAVVLCAVCACGRAETLTLSQALESTLRDHPLLRVGYSQVEYSRGALLRAQSQFDRTVQAGVSQSRTYQPLDEVSRTIYDATSATTNYTSFDFEGSQQFRNGITAGPMLTVSRTTDNIATQFGSNQSHLDFQLNIPLLRGRGRNVVGAQETATGAEVEASLLDLNQTVSDLLFNTAVSYWSAVAAKRSLDVFSQAEARGKLLLDTVQALIQADRIPRSDAAEVEANLADRSASRIAAEQQYLQATQQLAVAMGVSTENIAGAREPNDPLPPAIEMALPPGELPAVISNALTQRADFLATKKRVGEAETLAGAARNQLKPQVDLQLTSGYSGLRDGTNPATYLASPFGGVHGIDAVAGIRYSFPLENRAARGSVMQARSTLAQADYRSQDTARNIASSVVVAVEGVRSAVEQLEKVNQSVLHFQTALDNEREKYRLGVGSLVEVLTVEDRLTGVLVSQVQAELGYAIAVARLRQATGTIVAPDKAVQRVDSAVFLTLPEAPH